MPPSAGPSSLRPAPRIQHHQFGRRLEAVDGGLTRINLVFLFGISMISFGTALFGSYSANTLALTIYTVILVLVGVSTYGLWGYADRHGLLAGPAPPGAPDGLVVAVRTVIFLSAIPLGLLTRGRRWCGSSIRG